MGGFFFILALLCFLIYFIDKNKKPKNELERSKQAALNHLNNLPIADKHIPDETLLEAILITWLERPIDDISIHPIVDKYIPEDIRRNIKIAYYEVDKREVECRCNVGGVHISSRDFSHSSSMSIAFIFRMAICKEYNVLYDTPENMVYCVGNQYAIQNMEARFQEQLTLLELTFKIPGIIRTVTEHWGKYYIE